MFAGRLGQRLLVIDAEHGSSEKYAGAPGIPAFDVIVLTQFTPEDFIAALQAAEGYDVVILDSISPEWYAVLDIVNEETRHSRSGNSYTSGWIVGSPRHHRFIQAMLAYSGHLIATVRTKTHYVLVQGERGQVPKRMGTEWVARDGTEYEFDVCVELDLDNTLTVIKTRCSALHQQTVRRPTPAFMDPLCDWLQTGRQWRTVQELIDLVKDKGYGRDELLDTMHRLTPGVELVKDLNPTQIDILYEAFADQPGDLSLVEGLTHG
jgi:hypothetical protein